MPSCRLKERVPFFTEVILSSSHNPDGQRLWGSNLSEEGLFVQTTHGFRIGDHVSLRFHVADDEVRIPAAEVAWIRPFEPINVTGEMPGIGLQFVDIDPAVRECIRDHLQENLPVSPQHDTLAPSSLPPAPEPALQVAPAREDSAPHLRLSLPPEAPGTSPWSFLEKAQSQLPAPAWASSQEPAASLSPAATPPLEVASPLPPPPVLDSDPGLMPAPGQELEDPLFGSAAQDLLPLPPLEPCGEKLPAARNESDAPPHPLKGWTFERTHAAQALPASASQETSRPSEDSAPWTLGALALKSDPPAPARASTLDDLLLQEDFLSVDVTPLDSAPPGAAPVLPRPDLSFLPRGQTPGVEDPRGAPTQDEGTPAGFFPDEGGDGGEAISLRSSHPDEDADAFYPDDGRPDALFPNEGCPDGGFPDDGFPGGEMPSPSPAWSHPVGDDPPEAAAGALHEPILIPNEEQLPADAEPNSDADSSPFLLGPLPSLEDESGLPLESEGDGLFGSEADPAVTPAQGIAEQDLADPNDVTASLQYIGGLSFPLAEEEALSAELALQSEAHEDPDSRRGGRKTSAGHTWTTRIGLAALLLVGGIGVGAVSGMYPELLTELRVAALTLDTNAPSQKAPAAVDGSRAPAPTEAAPASTAAKEETNAPPLRGGEAGAAKASGASAPARKQKRAAAKSPQAPARAAKKDVTLASAIAPTKGKGPTKKNGMTIEQGRLTLPLEGGTVVRKFALSGPPRVVIDLEGAKYPGHRTQNIDEKGIAKVRIGRPDPERVRVVIDLEGTRAPRGISVLKRNHTLAVAWH